MEKSKERPVRRPKDGIPRYGNLTSDRSVVIRTSERLQLRLLGLGDTPSEGIERLVEFFDATREDPTNLLMRHISRFLIEMQTFYSKEEYEMWRNFGAFVKVALEKKVFTIEYLNGAVKFPEKKNE